MCLQKTEEFYSSAKAIPKVGEQYKKKCASSPIWYDRALTAVCPPAWPEEVQLTPGASVSALKGREAEPANRGRADADAHERKFLDFGKFADTRTCIRPSVRARGGKTLRQSSGIYHTERYNSQQNESFDINGLVCIFCITVNISFTVYAQVA